LSDAIAVTADEESI